LLSSARLLAKLFSLLSPSLSAGFTKWIRVSSRSRTKVYGGSRAVFLGRYGGVTSGKSSKSFASGSVSSSGSAIYSSSLDSDSFPELALFPFKATAS